MTTGETTRPLALESRSLREAAVVLALALLLVVGPHVLGLLGRASILALRRFSTWWPPAGVELLPLGVAGLVILVTAYALATRGSRRRSPGLPRGRRFLPPLDLILLQLGNVTFLAFALVLAVVTCGLLSSALRALVGKPWLVANSLRVSAAVAAAGALFELWRPLRSGPSRALRRRWSRRAAILGGAVGGFWLIGRGAEWSLSTFHLEDSQVDLPTLAILYGLLWVVLAGSALLVRFERWGTDASEPTPRRRRLAVALLLAWVAHLGFLSLYLNEALLTLQGHLAGT